MKYRHCVVSSVLVGLLTLAIRPAVGQSLLWEISGNGLRQPSYLFGTYHILKDSYLQKSPTVQRAYAGAEGVVVEMLVDSSAMLKVAMRGLMLDNSLEKLISPADYKLVSDEFVKQTGYNLLLFNRMKPIVTATMLGLAQAQKEADTLNSFTGQPIDLFFATNGKSRGKNVVGLETMEEQITLLYDHDPVQKQAEQLVAMVRDKAKTSPRDLTQLYLRGDLDAMYAVMKESEADYGNLAHLLDERNQNWMKRLPALLALRPTFVAVGAGHLPGPNGLLALLRKEGYVLKAVLK